MLGRVADVVRRHDGRIVSQTMYHAAEGHGGAIRSLQRLLGEIRWPITWVEDGDGAPELVATQVHAVCGPPVETVEAGGRTVGCTYEDTWARYCVLGDVRDADVSAPRPAQARRVFDEMSAALAHVGMSFRHVVRTWFYNDDILDWYGEFNAVRTGFFTKHGVFDGLVPGSTGIGAGNPFGAALTGSLIAVKPKGRAVRAEAVPSPLQSPALEYGSSFSRAVELSTPDQRRLFLSGTASIAPDGRTQHAGDVAAQIARTMEVAGAILSSRGMGWSDAVRGVAYLRRAADVGAFRRYCAELNLSIGPLVVTRNTICRDDLLFEFEAEAIVAGAAQRTEQQKTSPLKGLGSS